MHTVQSSLEKCSRIRRQEEAGGGGQGCRKGQEKGNHFKAVWVLGSVSTGPVVLEVLWALQQRHIRPLKTRSMYSQNGGCSKGQKRKFMNQLKISARS